MATTSTPPIHFPRVAIEFCVQCKWNLRAAYFAQELLQTFSTSIGEISLIPVTGGIFTITLYHHDKPETEPEPGSQTDGQTTTDSETVVSSTEASSDSPSITTSVIWDRKRDGGFPETKELKNRVRNIIEPGKDMGHVDRALREGKEGGAVKQDVVVEGHDKVDEASKGDKSGKGTVEASPEQPAKAEEKPVTSSTAVHAEHKHATATPDDCEECRDALKS